MPPESSRLAAALLAAGLALALAACAAPPPLSPPPPVAAPAPHAEPAPLPEPPAPPPPPPASDTPSPAVLALLHADRVRGLPPAELAQEVARLAPAADADTERRGPPSPLAQVQFALTLMQTRTALDAVRAGQALQRVLGQDTPEARTLHPLARQLLAQLAEQKRLEDLVERQGQQLRDSQRRAEQLNDRLDALRAIERGRPRPQ